MNDGAIMPVVKFWYHFISKKVYRCNFECNEFEIDGAADIKQTKTEFNKMHIDNFDFDGEVFIGNYVLLHQTC